ncbi:hypothetical protein K7H13_03470 [Qipengyuania citrea]|uniref:hypothetical protein n=1 Tax=Qipengyuania citrea TaxID=225971 RepID=UPI001E5CE70A|nr:hypothetical protein [Qipengyuania citrea]MCD1589822.1 hypothetical protein [Qipengyuania citrea]
MDDTGYKERYVAFLDILGFADLTQRADNSPNWRAWLRSCIDALNTTVPRQMDSVGFRFVQFSDSIVMSADRTPNGLDALFRAVSMLYRNMLTRGILLRGGVAAGNFHHDENMMFGPALVKAYSFEKSGAPPHIGLHEHVLEDMKPSLVAQGGLNHWLTYDPFDLTPILHVLLDFALYDGIPSAGKEVLEEPSFYLARDIEATASNMAISPAARAKWRWVQHYWNQTVALRGILPQSSPTIDWNMAWNRLKSGEEARLEQYRLAEGGGVKPPPSA